MTDRPFVLGTRGSPLALAQARMTAAALEQAHGWPTGHVQLRIVRTSGDRIQDRPLAEVGGKALWTKELDLALLAGETDASVHSMKDVESDRPAELVIAAMLERADVRDRLIGGGAVTDLAPGAVVGTSSPRRSAQLRRIRPDLNIISIRGNVETRLTKMQAGDVDATLLAAAGLDRLGRQETGVAIPIDVMLPAPAQGAVGVECRTEDRRAIGLLQAIDHRPTHAAVNAERAFAKALGGSCHSPVAALATITDEGVRLQVELLSEDGQQSLRENLYCAIDDLFAPAELARRMLAGAPASIACLFDGA